MDTKIKRKNEILRLISENVITTQDEILDDLKALGFNVTQATVSRDMRELKISKITDPNGVLRYSVPGVSQTHKNTFGLKSALTESIVKIDYACNDIVIHTMPGLAQAIAGAIDSLHIENVLGCVAGDDTILIITRSNESAAEICVKIRNMLKNS
jgi:transcriptional regulator of arginine metabolism